MLAPAAALNNYCRIAVTGIVECSPLPPTWSLVGKCSMKTPTGEIDLRADNDAAVDTSSGASSANGFDLYDELDDLVDLSEEIPIRPEEFSLSSSLDSFDRNNGDGQRHSDDVIAVSGYFTNYRSAGSQLMVCVDCGCSAESDEVFCIRCGGPLEEQGTSGVEAASPARLCADCGEMVEADEIICPSCGSVMADA